jgi:hypothetical protein
MILLAVLEYRTEETVPVGTHRFWRNDLVLRKRVDIVVIESVEKMRCVDRNEALP